MMAVQTVLDKVDENLPTGQGTEALIPPEEQKYPAAAAEQMVDPTAFE